MQKLNNSQDKIMETFANNGALTYADIATITGLSYDGVRGRISELSKLGYDIEKFKDGGQTLLKYGAKRKRMPQTATDRLIIKSKSFDDFNGLSAFLEKIRTTKFKNIKRVNVNTDDVEETGLLVLSDLHIGEIIEDQTYGNVIYNTETALERLDTLTEAVNSELLCRKIKNLTIAIIGDVVDGDSIYKNHLFRIEKPAIEQVQDGVTAISTMIKKIVAHGIDVTVECVRGNHGITNYKNLEEDNWDNVVYNMLEIVFMDNKNVNLNAYPNSEAKICVADKRAVLCHGENIGSQIKTSSGLKEFRGMCAKHKLDDGDMILVGHLHSFGIEYDQGKLIVRNGALSDSSEYAYKKNLFSKPEQTLLIVREGENYPEIIPLEI